MSKPKALPNWERVLDVIKIKKVIKQNPNQVTQIDIFNLRCGVPDLTVVDPYGTTDHIPIESYHLPYDLWSKSINPQQFEAAERAYKMATGRGKRD